MQAITICQPSSTSNNQTLICLPFSCFALLVPHCCSSAFWIAVARFSLCILHRSSLRYVVVASHSPQLDRLPSTTGSLLTEAGYSHHTISTYPFSARHCPARLNTRLQQRSVAGPPQGVGFSAMSLAYKVEELLALRDSVSESAVSIDRFADEDVIKGQWSPIPCHAFTSLHHTSFHLTAPHSLLGLLLTLSDSASLLCSSRCDHIPD